MFFTIQKPYEGIPFQWGGTQVGTGLDCFSLADLVRYRETNRRERLNRAPVDWVYLEFPDLNGAPIDIVQSVATRVTMPVEVPRSLDLVLITNRAKVVCLGTILEDTRIVFMSSAGSREVALDRLSRSVDSIEFVRPRQDLIWTLPN
jgi:hypothetical protein